MDSPNRLLNTSKTVTHSEIDSEFDDLKSEVSFQDENLLSINDHLTNPQTLNFWKRYFSEYCTQVTVENFYEAVQ